MMASVAGETAGELDPKAGHGGLVDVEFATQYLQLLHGGRLSAVRGPNTLLALEALGAEGVLAAEDGRLLRAGYLFHRRVENRLRLVHGRALARLFYPWFDFLSHGWHHVAAHSAGTAVAFLGITFMHVVFGELVPKAFALQTADRTALWTARPLLMSLTMARAMPTASKPLGW